MKHKHNPTFALIITIFIFLMITLPHTSSTLQNIQPNLQTMPGGADGTITKWAVIIACSGGVSYERHERRDRHDVQALTTQLLNHGWDTSHIYTLLEEQATTTAILHDSFQWLIDHGEDEDDIILFFYSGHGYYHTTDEPPLDEPDGCDEVIYPWDPDMAGWNWDVIITDDAFAESFDVLHPQNIIIIMHTCHAGGFIDGTCDFPASGRIVLAACDVNEASCMMHFPIHWLFPYYVIQGLKGRADKNHDKNITAEELFRYTTTPVQLRSLLYNWLHTRGIYIQHPQLADNWPTTTNNQDELTFIHLP